MNGSRTQNRIYMIGAGITGMTLAKEIQDKGLFGRVVAFLDDDPEKIGRSIYDIPVLGPLEAVVDLIKTTPADEAIIAIPGATREQLKRIYATLKRAQFTRIRIVPRISHILEGEAHLIQAREIDPEDLLSREPVRINLKTSLSYLRGKRVLVTGAGGSIGRELSRQLLFGGAERLYLFGHGENSIYEIERDLRILQEEGVGEKAIVVPIIGELLDRDYMHYILPRLKADVVFHAAAHKHVPMLEANPVEAVKNNVFGTKNVVDACAVSGTQRFVLISTDKAVEPTSIYGASKLLAEEIVLKAGSGGRSFVVVRFGNVLGSRGSILPLFSRQILKGGPLTLTDRETKRFFMTIPEAVSLVLQTGGVGEPGALYLLDMGEPLSIKDLAEQMIRFYGYQPEKEIRFQYVGLRPGEKLIERLWAQEDTPCSTPYSKIMKLNRATALNGHLEGIMQGLKPVCFFDPHREKEYRNRQRLREVLKQDIPHLRIPEDEPRY